MVGSTVRPLSQMGSQPAMHTPRAVNGAARGGQDWAQHLEQLLVQYVEISGFRLVPNVIIPHHQCSAWGTPLLKPQSGTTHPSSANPGVLAPIPQLRQTGVQGGHAREGLQCSRRVTPSLPYRQGERDLPAEETGHACSWGAPLAQQLIGHFTCTVLRSIARSQLTPRMWALSQLTQESPYCGH